MPTIDLYTIIFLSMSVQHSSKYRLLCSTEERNSYRFRTTWQQL